MKCFNRESKCVHDTYEKNDFAILTGTYLYTDIKNKQLNLPEGFTNYNSVIISSMVRFRGSDGTFDDLIAYDPLRDRDGVELSLNIGSDYIDGKDVYYVQANLEYMNADFYTHGSDMLELKIVVMKIS